MTPSASSRLKHRLSITPSNLRPFSLAAIPSESVRSPSMCSMSFQKGGLVLPRLKMVTAWPASSNC